MLAPSLFRCNLGEDLFGDMFEDFFKPAKPEKPVPAVMRTNVKEKENEYVLDVELPGYQKEDITAELKDGYLTIAAKKDENKEDKDEDGHLIRCERIMGSCRRSFFVGDDVTEEDIKAGFNNGILTVTVPKKKPEKKEEERKLIAIE